MHSTHRYHRPASGSGQCRLFTTRTLRFRARVTHFPRAAYPAYEPWIFASVGVGGWASSRLLLLRCPTFCKQLGRQASRSDCFLSQPICQHHGAAHTCSTSQPARPPATPRCGGVAAGSGGGRVEHRYHAAAPHSPPPGPSPRGRLPSWPPESPSWHPISPCCLSGRSCGCACSVAARPQGQPAPCRPPPACPRPPHAGWGRCAPRARSARSAHPRPAPSAGTRALPPGSRGGGAPRGALSPSPPSLSGRGAAAASAAGCRGACAAAPCPATTRRPPAPPCPTAQASPPHSGAAGPGELPAPGFHLVASARRPPPAPSPPSLPPPSTRASPPSSAPQG
jgi:hypothetical protein